MSVGLRLATEWRRLEKKENNERAKTTTTHVDTIAVIDPRGRASTAKRTLHSEPTERRQSGGTADKPDAGVNPETEESAGGERIIPERFSHLDNTGKARMVNVGAKACTRRVAMARGEIYIGKNVLDKLLDGSLGTKGDIVTVAKVAGIMGAKRTCELIPMCHQIALDHVRVEIEPRQADGCLVVKAKVEAEHKTGVELECMTAVSVTLLTIYDMCKSISRDMVISDVHLVYKTKLPEQY